MTSRRAIRKALSAGKDQQVIQVGVDPTLGLGIRHIAGEMVMLQAARSALARQLGLPSMSSGGCSCE